MRIRHLPARLAGLLLSSSMSLPAHAAASQVRTVATKYFAPENQTIVVVGDPKAVSEQLKPFGEFTDTDK